MSLKITTAALVIGLSSVASAQPIASAQFSGSFEGGLHVRDHRSAPYDRYAPGAWHEPVYYARPYRPRWINLGTFDVTTIDGPAQIEFDVHGRPISQLFLRQNGRKSRLFRVDIVYANGRVRSIEMDTYLGDLNGQGSPTLTIDLPRARSPISHIVITANNARQSSFSVYGI